MRSIFFFLCLCAILSLSFHLILFAQEHSVSFVNNEIETGHSLLQNHNSFTQNQQTNLMIASTLDNDVNHDTQTINNRLYRDDGHQYFILAVAYDNEHELIFTGSGDNTIKVWDQNTLCHLYTLTDHNGPITQLIYNREQKQLLSASMDMTLRIWDVPSFECNQILVGHIDSLYSLALDNEMIISGDGEGTIKKWVIQDHQYICTHTATPSDTTIYDLALDAQNNRCFSVDKNGMFRIHKLNNLETQRTQQMSTSALLSIAFEQDCQLLSICGEEGSLYFWNLQSMELQQSVSINHASLYSVVWIIPNQRVAFAGSNNTITTYDLTTDGIHTFYGEHQGAIYDIAYNPINDTIISGSWDKALALWNAEFGYLTRCMVAMETPIMDVVSFNDKNQVVTLSESFLTLWNFEDPNQSYCVHLNNYKMLKSAENPVSNQLALLLQHKEYSAKRIIRLLDDQLQTLSETEVLRYNPMDLTFVPNLHAVAVIGESDSVYFYNTQTGESVDRIPTGLSRLNTIDFFTDNQLYLLSNVNGDVFTLDYDQGTTQTLIQLNQSLTDSQLDFQNQRVVSLLENGLLSTYHPARGEPMIERYLTTSDSGCFILSGSNQLLVAGDGYGNLICYDLLTLQPQWDIKLNGESINTIDIGKNGSWIFAGTSSGMTYMVHTQTGEPAFVLAHNAGNPVFYSFNGNCYGYPPFVRGVLMRMNHQNINQPVDRYGHNFALADVISQTYNDANSASLDEYNQQLHFHYPDLIILNQLSGEQRIQTYSDLFSLKVVPVFPSISEPTASTARLHIQWIHLQTHAKESLVQNISTSQSLQSIPISLNQEGNYLISLQLQDPEGFYSKIYDVVIERKNASIEYSFTPCNPSLSGSSQVMSVGEFHLNNPTDQGYWMQLSYWFSNPLFPYRMATQYLEPGQSLTFDLHASFRETEQLEIHFILELVDDSGNKIWMEDHRDWP